jgi:X-X-X-Leu-X-X-Gly heptad repeat protein
MRGTRVIRLDRRKVDETTVDVAQHDVDRLQLTGGAAQLHKRARHLASGVGAAAL